MKAMLARAVRIAAIGVLGLVTSCSSQKFDAIPASVDPAKVPNQTVEMTAQKFKFTPDEVHVKQGTLVTIDVKSIEGTHGFALPAFGIDELLEQGQPKTIRFYAGETGEYEFKCSHFCGSGHFGMRGRIVVEPK